MTVRIAVDCDWPDGCGSIALSPPIDNMGIIPPSTLDPQRVLPVVAAATVNAAVADDGYTHTEEGLDYCSLHSLHDIANLKNRSTQ